MTRRHLLGLWHRLTLDDYGPTGYRLRRYIAHRRNHPRPAHD